MDREALGVLSLMQEAMDSQAQSAKSILSVLQAQQGALTSVLSLFSMKMDPQARVQLARVHTALSTDNPQLWHDALVSVETYLKTRTGSSS